MGLITLKEEKERRGGGKERRRGGGKERRRGGGEKGSSF